jgi:hypothetical protein
VVSTSVFRSIFSIFRNPAAVETRQRADELMIELERLAVEHHHRDAREGIVLLADTLMERLEQFAPELRDSAALLMIASLCPRCRDRREAAKMRRWRAKRRPRPVKLG